MKFKIIILLALVIIAAGAQISKAEECNHTGLSKKLDYKVNTVKAKDENDSLRTTKIYVRIFNKISKKQTQQIIINAEYLFEDAYSKCSAVKSNDNLICPKTPPSKSLNLTIEKLAD